MTASPKVTVPSTATYYDRFSGIGYKLKSGQQITQRRAWLLQLPGVSQPGSGLDVIHNYFPDGAISSAALIDTEASYDADKLWRQYGGSETLSFVAAADLPSLRNRFNVVKVECPGNSFGEGVYVGDWANTFDGWVDPGRYRVGVTVLSGVQPLMVALDGRNNGGNTHEWSGGVVLIPNLSPRRVVLDIATAVACTITVAIGTTQDYPINGLFPAAQADTFYVGQLMITEGDPLVFRDGASSGWSWSGTAHASVSSGPQP